MIYFRCIEEVTDEELNATSLLARNIFFNFTRLVNASGGFPNVYEADKDGIKCVLKYVYKGEIQRLGFPQKRLQKIITAMNASHILNAEYWPVNSIWDIVEGKNVTIISIRAGEAESAKFLRHSEPFYSLSNIVLQPHRLKVESHDSNNNLQALETSLPDDPLERALISLGLDVSQIDLAEMQRLVEKRARNQADADRS